MKRAAGFSLLLLTAVALQSSIFSSFTLFGVSPDLVVIVVVSLGLLEGPSVAAGAGFGGGLLKDFLLETPLGLTGLAYLTVGYIVGSVRPYLQSTSVLLPVAAVGAGSMIAGALYVILTFLFGGQPDPLARIARVVLLGSVYNVLLTPFIFPLIRKLSEAYPKDRVYRW